MMQLHTSIRITLYPKYLSKHSVYRGNNDITLFSLASMGLRILLPNIKHKYITIKNYFMDEQC